MSTEMEEFITKFGGVTESYLFYDGEVTLRYDVKNHVYLLETPEGLEVIPGVSTVSHIIDKSRVLMQWAVKQMEKKLLVSVPVYEDTSDENKLVNRLRPIEYEQFVKIVGSAKTTHKDELEEAGLVGHTAHAWIEKLIKIQIKLNSEEVNNSLFPDEYELVIQEQSELLRNFPADQRAKNCCLAALNWMNRHNVRWIHTERKVYSRKYKYAGTLDGLCLVDSCDDPECCPTAYKDHLSVADWKTSNSLHKEFRYQTAAYEAAYEEEFGVDIVDRWIIRLGKDDAEFDPWPLGPEAFQIDFHAFIKSLELTLADAAVEQSMNQAFQARKLVQRAERLAAKEEALKLRCNNADTYQGLRLPGCNGGTPCLACRQKYQDTQARLVIEREQREKEEAKKAAKQKAEKERALKLEAVAAFRAQFPEYVSHPANTKAIAEEIGDHRWSLVSLTKAYKRLLKAKKLLTEAV